MDDSAIIVSLNSEEIYKLNSTGTKIVELVEKGKSVQEIITMLGEIYEIKEAELEKEITELMNELQSAGLIEAIQ